MEEKAVKLLLRCVHPASRNYLAEKMVEYLLRHPEGVTLYDIKRDLGVGIATAHKLVKELEAVGIVETAWLKVAGRRGRARKLVRLNWRRMSQIAEELATYLERLKREAMLLA